MTTLVARIPAKVMAVIGLACAVTSVEPSAQAGTPAAGMRFAPNFVSQPAFDAVARAQIGVSPAERGIVAVSRPLKEVRDFGRMRSDKPVEVGFIMRYRNEAQLAQLTLAQSQRNSPYYHRFLKPAQFVNYFAPDAATYARTIATLQRRGFRITQTFANRSAIRTTAPAGVVERYFQTELHQVYQPNVRNGYRHINVRPGIIPAELRGSIVSISGLNSTVMVQMPIRHANKAIRHRMLAQMAAARRAMRHPGVARPATVPTPIGTATPGNAVPGPDPTESPNDPVTDYENEMGYYPATFADAYDYPVQHGFGGGPSASTIHAAGSVIYYDYADSDANQEFTEFDIGKRTGGLGVRRCSDPTATPYCDGIETGNGNPNPPAGEDEATLDAETIMSLAPAAPFYEYLAPQADDLSIQFAYELVVSDDYVDAVNSSFGGCEAADPDGEFADNYIAMEGAALGITFSASSGDTGSTGCGLYVTNGAPQSEINVESPAAGTYFTAVGGSDFFPLTTCSGVGNASPTSPCYTHEDVWTFGGGGYSIFEPEPAYQATVTAGSEPTNFSANGRNVPDLVFTADPDPPGTAMIIVLGGSETVVGGTSLASPMWVAMVTTINQVQDSRSGWLDPSLYAIYYAQNCMSTGTTVCGTAAATAPGPFAFRNLTGGTNGAYQCLDGYNDACGLGSPLGWELAGSLYGTPGGAGPAHTPGPTPTPIPTPIGGASPSPTPTPSPTPAPTLTPSGTNYKVTTIGGSSGCQTSSDGTGTAACFAGPAGITYVPSSATDVNTQSATDNVLFVMDFATGYLRSVDLTTDAVATLNKTEFSQATVGSDVQGIAYFPTGPEVETADGLYFLSEGGTTGNGWYYADLPYAANGTINAGNIKALSGQPAAIAFNTTTGIEAGIVNAKNGDISCIEFATTESLTFEGGISTGGLAAKGNYGIAFYPNTSSAPPIPEYYVTDSGANTVYSATDLCAEGMASTVTTLTTGAPLNLPKEIVYDSGANGGSGAFFIANEGGNNILRLLPGASTATIVAGNGAPTESDGYNTGAGFNAPFGITTDNTNLYVTDSGGDTVREITAIP